MAGSYKHAVADDGQLLDYDHFIGMIENLGDVYEMAVEMYGMIHFLALELAYRDGVAPPERIAYYVEAARKSYMAGIAVSPGTDGTNPRED